MIAISNGIFNVWRMRNSDCVRRCLRWMILYNLARTIERPAPVFGIGFFIAGFVMEMMREWIFLWPCGQQSID